MIFRVLMLVGLWRFLGVGFGHGGIKSVLEWDTFVFKSTELFNKLKPRPCVFFGRTRAPAFHIFLTNQTEQLGNTAL